MRLQDENTLALERDLLSKVAEGDHLAFKVIYERYYDRIYKFAFKIMGTREPAEEIVQEAMLYIWQQGYKLKKVASIEAYLKTTAKHKAIDAFRRKVLTDKAEAQIGAEYNDAFELDDDGNLLSTARAVLEEGIDKLPPQQRQVYQLCYQEGLKYEQVAEKLHISHGTVQTHMKFALKFLRNYVQNHSDVASLLIIFKLL